MAFFLFISLTACRGSNRPVEPPPIDSTATRAHRLPALIASQDTLSTLSDLLEATGLAETLRASGPYTVFAPTDAAFRRAFPLLDSLRTEGLLDSLRRVLSHHIVRGRLYVPTPGSLRVSTLRAAPLTLYRSPADGPLRVNNRQVMQMLEAQNGLLYVLPTVLPLASSDSLRGMSADS